MIWNVKTLAALYPAGPTAQQVADIRAAGWKISDGVVAPRGFFRAAVGGGYVGDVTQATAIQIGAGCPASHATVAWRTD